LVQRRGDPHVEERPRLIGAGIAGQVAAIALQRAGITADTPNPPLVIGRDFFVNGSSRVESETSRQRTPGLLLRKEFPFLTGQPEEVRAAYRRAMGLPETGVDARSPAS